MSERLAELRKHTQAMVAALSDLVEAESPSVEVEAAHACAREVARIGKGLLGAGPEWVELGGRPHLRWTFGPPRVLLLGHFDTVWPLGTTARWHFSVSDGRATGPGAFDMKGGVVQVMHALACLEDVEGVTLLLTSDEELGSPTSRPLIEELARSVRAALVLEPSAGGALKTARKGVAMYELHFAGRAAHAGLGPQHGANALVELARVVEALRDMDRPGQGTTVVPTMASAGTARNTIPAEARLLVDSRAATAQEQARVDEAIRALRPSVEGVTITVQGGPNRPPMTASRELFERAQRAAETLGIGPLRGVTVGGGSDGNFTAAQGTPTLDGLGPLGDGAHAEGEHVLVSSLPERAALVAELVAELLQEP